jgi:polar amino acid transport system substrate-binding protein
MKVFHVIFVFLCFCNSSIASEKLVVASDIWCPYICDDKQSPGYIVELVRDVLQQNNIDFKFESLPLARAMQFAASNQVDMVLGLTNKHITEHKLAKSSLSVGQVSLDYFVATDNPWRYASHQELIKYLGKDKKIGIVKGYSYGDFFNALIKSKPELFYVSHGNSPLEINLNLLNLGRIDILIGNNNTVSYNAGPESRLNLVHAGNDDEIGLIYVGFAPYIKPAIIQMLDQGIVDYRKSGKLKILLDKYGITDWQSHM